MEKLRNSVFSWNVTQFWALNFLYMLWVLYLIATNERTSPPTYIECSSCSRLLDDILRNDFSRILFTFSTGPENFTKLY